MIKAARNQRSTTGNPEPVSWAAPGGAAGAEEEEEEVKVSGVVLTSLWHLVAPEVS